MNTNANIDISYLSGLNSHCVNLNIGETNKDKVTIHGL